MTLDEYQWQARETAVYEPQHSISYTSLGLAGEAGEVANQAKKMIRDDGGVVTFVRQEKLIDELGDVLWYAAALATDLGFKLSEVCARNLDKLAKRRAENAIHGDAR